MISSTVSSESAPRSSTKEASGVTSAPSTPSCSTMIFFTFSATSTVPLTSPPPAKTSAPGALHPQAPVDMDDLTRDVRRAIRGQENNQLRHLLGGRLGQTDDPRLGGDVVGLPGISHDPHHRGEIDDASPPSLQHGSEGSPRTMKDPLQIGAQHRLPFLILHPQQTGVPGDSGLVHQDCPRPEPLKTAFDHLLDLRRLGHIGLDCQDLSP